ncbi:hypothetical protein V2J09_010480 [Rumex salicifolius]
MGVSVMMTLLLAILAFCVLPPKIALAKDEGITRHYQFDIVMQNVTRLCQTKSIVTVNGQFPGPRIIAREGDRLVIRVVNHVPNNITIHWHGIRQLRSGWADGPAYITQCPIQTGQSYTYNYSIVGQRGTLFWHAHISWLRATLYGPIIILPKRGSSYPFVKPYKEVPIIFGEWFKGDTEAIISQALKTGGGPNVSDAYTINGLPGPLYNCSAKDTFKLKVKPGKTYLLRLINAALNDDLFFSIADHSLTVVDADAVYVKPFTVNTLLIAPGQTTNVLLHTKPVAPPTNFLMMARPYVTGQGTFDNSTVAGVLEYHPFDRRLPLLTPTLPALNDTSAATNFSARLRSLATPQFPANVPLTVDRQFFFTIGLGTNPCDQKNGTCQGPTNTTKFAASVNNVSFVQPSTALLQAHFTGRSNGVYSPNFPSSPFEPFNYTGNPPNNTMVKNATKVVVLPFNASVEVVLQDTSILGAESHPLHLHGFNFFVVGSGFGNFDPNTDPARYNLVDPVERNTVAVPVGGWVAFRFFADNPGAWFMHCHFEVHTSWGLKMAWIVLDGNRPDQKLLPPPADLPKINREMEQRNFLTMLVLLATALLVWPQLTFAKNRSVTRRYNFVVKMQTVTRLCQPKNIVTVNGQFPGPRIIAREGDKLEIRVVNQVNYNVTIHWHGIRQLRSGWADGPAYITQCPIQTGQNYVYKFTVTGQRGTLFWHAHISWLRVTLYGPIVILPKKGVPYPFPQPHQEVSIIFGEWWKTDTEKMINQATQTGSAPNISDAFTINGLPGPLYSKCSTKDTFKLKVKPGKTYLLRLINAALNDELFFRIANHTLTVVEVDAVYVKPFKTDVVVITPGQTTNVLVKTKLNSPNAAFLMAARAYATGPATFDNTTTAAILEYEHPAKSSKVALVKPKLPKFNDTSFAAKFVSKLRSLANSKFPANVPKKIDRHFFFTVGLGLISCAKTQHCPNNTMVAAGINNVSFVQPNAALLQAHFSKRVNGVFANNFPQNPQVKFNYTGTPPKNIFMQKGTKVVELGYNTKVELVMQDTSIIGAESHPLHLHGFNFFVVGQGFGNFDSKKDPSKFNLVDPVERNTVGVPSGGWVAIRFMADNPGVWFMHCHLEVHTTWGLKMAWVVNDGKAKNQKLPPPPSDLPKC